MDKISIGIYGENIEIINEYYSRLNKFRNYNVYWIVENNIDNLKKIQEKFDLNICGVYGTMKEFIDNNSEVEAIIICTNSFKKYNINKNLLSRGYYIIDKVTQLNTLDNIINISKGSYINKLLPNYKNFKETLVIKEVLKLIKNKELGNIISINYQESIGYARFTHDYVRGELRSSSDCAPLIVDKGVSIIELVLNLLECKCIKVSSFGSNKNFIRSKDIYDDCLECKNDQCPYNSRKIYSDDDKAYKIPYKRCVYKCDNSVDDNIVSILEFENREVVSININAFSNKEENKIEVMLNKSKIYISFSEEALKISKFGYEEEEVRFSDLLGDNLIEKYNEFINTTIKLSNTLDRQNLIDSYITAFAIEYSKISEELINVEDFYLEAKEMSSLMDEEIKNIELSHS